MGRNPTSDEFARLKHAFDHAKAENDDLLTERDTHAFVHTRVYREAVNGHRSLLVGRKGSGKTALLLGYKHEQSQRYFAQGAIDIRADDFPLESLFSFFYAHSVSSAERITRSLPQISDLPAFIDPVKLSAYAWGHSLRCAAVYVAADRLLLRGNSVDKELRAILIKARKALNKYMGARRQPRGDSGSEVVFSLLVYFFQSVQGVVDNALGIHTQEISVLLAAITRNITLKLASRLDERVEAAARAISSFLEAEGAKCLLTLDKFDDYYDEFYRRSKKQESVQERRQFLEALLHGLVLATRDLKHDTRFKWLDTLFAVPADKFLELHIRERAELEQAHVLKLQWTPVELYEYVNKRIAYALELPPDSVERAWDVIFPFEVANAKVKDVKEPSFLYVVRHSLWRPREIQMYLRAILAQMEAARGPATEEMFRTAVRNESQQIVRSEFLEEFLSENPGIIALMEKLEGLALKSVMSYADLRRRIAGIKLFETELAPADVMLRLFHMGIIGVRHVFARERRASLDRTITQHRQEVAYRFAYNCTLSDPFTSTSEVVFHPMFFHYLDIKHEKKYVINQMAWDMFFS
jgi:hypothetical protein